MPGRKKETMDTREMLRRLRKGQSNRAIAKAMKVNRKTVSRYRSWATEQGLMEGPLSSLSDLQRLLDETMAGSPPPQNTSTVEPYRELVVKLREQKVEIAAIHERLREREYFGSYSAVYRFVRNLEPKEPEVMVRVETPPGEEGQVDFGFAGMMIDPETGALRKTWVFVMVLSWSRHQYAEFVFDQKVETWLRLHRNAFAFFGGYMRNRQVLDPRLDNSHHLGYTTFAQRKRGKAVVLAIVFSRFQLEGAWLSEADGHCEASSLDAEGCMASWPRAAVA